MKLGTALLEQAPLVDPLFGLDSIVPVVSLFEALGWIAQNNTAELTNQAGPVQYVSLTAPADGYFRVWGSVSLKTATAASQRFSLYMNDETNNSVLTFFNVYLPVAAGSSIFIPPPGLLVWMKNKWAVQIVQSTSTGVGETIRADVSLQQLLQA